MNRKMFSILAIVAVSFVIVLSAGVSEICKAAPGISGESSSIIIAYISQTVDYQSWFSNEKQHADYDVGRVSSQKLLERDLEADAPTFSQDRDILLCMNEGYPTCDGNGEDTPMFSRD